MRWSTQAWGWGNIRTLGLIAAGAVVLALFVAIEHVTADPLVPLGIFRGRSVSLSAVILLLDFFALFGVLFFIGLYLQSVHGYSPAGAGVRLLPLTVMFAFSGNLGARLVERFGPWLPPPPTRSWATCRWTKRAWPAAFRSRPSSWAGC